MKCFSSQLTIHDAIDDGSCILENTPMGTIVRTFGSTDADTAAANIDHVYEIESGGLNTAGDVSFILVTINHK